MELARTRTVVVIRVVIVLVLKNEPQSWLRRVTLLLQGSDASVKLPDTRSEHEGPPCTWPVGKKAPFLPVNTETRRIKSENVR